MAVGAITAMKVANSTGPTAATLTKDLNPNGPIVEVVGMMKNIQLTLQETQLKLNTVIQATDAADPNLVNLQNTLTALTSLS